ncbi:hypothetical protein [Eikenella corrodens]|uniref:Uncharacterized protein n=1 Tax=Eikenella corrodens TaxID=539 RepID=A0A3S9SLP4_EIKCO|nr:hypothetical protein [Eikenella corrodens]AZR60461.1 hypothetical protein ELB75_10860 [Eikenella corrodens]
MVPNFQVAFILRSQAWVGWTIALICPVAKSALLLPGSRTVGEKTAFAASRPIDLKDYSEAQPPLP